MTSIGNSLRKWAFALGVVLTLGCDGSRGHNPSGAGGGTDAGDSTDAVADFTDAGGDSTDCTSAECGPAPQTTGTFDCSDGTVAGPVCTRYKRGVCAWSLTACPGSTACQGEACGPVFPFGLCSGLGNYAVCVTDGTHGCRWKVTCPELP